MGALDILGENQPETAPAKTRPHDYGRDLERSLVNSLPMAGGMIGGGLGGSAGALAGGVGAVPGAMGGAVLGGMGGEAGKQLLSRALGLEDVPETGNEATVRIANQGALQGAFEPLSAGLGLASRAIGKSFIQSAGRMTPEAAETAARERIPVTPSGLDKVMAKLKDLGEQTRAAVSVATRKGVRFDPNKDVMQPVLAKILPLVKAGGDPEGETAKVMDMARTWLEGRFKPTGPGVAALPDQISPLELFKAKRASDAIAEPIFKGQERMNVTEFDPLKQQFHKALGDQIRDLFDTVPGVSDLNARASKLISLKQALEPLTRKQLPFAGRVASRGLPVLAGGMAGALIPGSPLERSERGVAGMALGAGLGAPGPISNVGLALQGPQTPFAQMLLGQSPRLMAMLAPGMMARATAQ